MTEKPDDDDVPFYGPARIRAAAALIALVCVLAIIDAASDKFSLDPIPLGLFLGTAAAFLSVDTIKRFTKP